MKFNLKDIKQMATALIAGLSAWAVLGFSVDPASLSAAFIAFTGGGLSTTKLTK